jgi:acyl dehydratase
MTATPREILLYREDFPAGSVREFGNMPVTREAVLAFAQQFDTQAFPMDDAAAEASHFGRLAARPMASRATVGLTQFGWEVLNQRGVIVLTMQGSNMFGRREPAPA